jgi:CRP/FNR family transcriptional regulator
MDIITDLERLPLFAGLSKEELAPLAEVGRLETFPKGKMLCEKGESGKALYVIKSGKVRIFTTDDEGHDVALNVCGKGDFIGELSLLDGLPHSASAAALEPSNIIILERDEFLTQLESHPRIALRVLSAISMRLRGTTERAERMAFLNIYGRLALQLLELSEQHGRPVTDGIEIDLDLTPDDLASLAGIDPQGLRRVLQFYGEAGLVEINWPRIVVRDEAGLRQRLSWHRRKRLV